MAEDEIAKNVTLDSNTEQIELASFSSPVGVLCSCLGCVLGTGNIWRFPRIIATASYSQGWLTYNQIN